MNPLLTPSPSLHGHARRRSNACKTRSGSSPECTLAPICIADGVDWESSQRYSVHLDNEWIVVPDGAVIAEPNRIGRTMVWKHYIDGQPRVRCFAPGSMT